MKCGTTSLHHILQMHRDVFLADREIHFFDIDDMVQHPDFFTRRPGEWMTQDFERDLARNLDWYAAFFAEARPGHLIGESSTTYLASDKVPTRIARILPNVKLIFMLRDPASRTYSHYWHLVRTGRAVHRFDRLIQSDPGTLIQRSLYQPQIERFMQMFPTEALRFILFEQFVADPAGIVEDVCQFLGVPFDPALVASGTHFNPGAVPKNLGLTLLRNWLLRPPARDLYAPHLPTTPTPPRTSPLRDWIDRGFRVVAPIRVEKPPEMTPATRKFLNQMLARENAGLAQLIGVDVERYWYRD